MSKKARTDAARRGEYQRGKRAANVTPRTGAGRGFTTSKRPVTDRRQPPGPFRRG